jgi:hypothetical protein
MVTIQDGFARFGVYCPQLKFDVTIGAPENRNRKVKTRPQFLNGDKYERINTGGLFFIEFQMSSGKPLRHGTDLGTCAVGKSLKTSLMAAIAIFSRT